MGSEGHEVEIGVVDFNLVKMGSEGHDFDFKLCLENREPMAALAVADAAAMILFPVFNRYRLHVDDTDGSKTVVMVLFDKEAELLVKHSASELISELNEYNTTGSTILLNALVALIGSTHVFEVKTQTYYQFGPYESFNCLKVIHAEVDKPSVSAAEPEHALGKETTTPCSSSKRLRSLSPISTPDKSSGLPHKEICDDILDSESFVGEMCVPSTSSAHG